MIATKAFYKSKGFWGPLISLFALFAQQAGLGEIDQTELLDAILTLFEWGGVAWAFYGRLVAKTKLGLKDSQIEVFATEPPKATAHWLATLVAVVLALSIAGCATFFRDVEPETPAQEYWAVRADYEAALRIANAYKRDCTARPAGLKFGCDRHVAEIQRIDNDVIFPALTKGHAALDAGDDVLIGVAAETLARALDELIAYLTANGIGGARSGELDGRAMVLLWLPPDPSLAHGDTR